LAGTVALHDVEAEFRFVLVHATDGGAGDIRHGFPATRRHSALSDVASAKPSGAHGRVPDGTNGSAIRTARSTWCASASSSTGIAAILSEEEPDVVATFGPDGITAHPDHITVGVATDAGVARFVEGDGPGLRGLVHRVLPTSVFGRWQHQRREDLESRASVGLVVELNSESPTRPW
jgi:LmbE family N-acetylglucosaminyl deacetylase